MLTTARSAEVETPTGLGSKCGKWVERFSDFGKYKGNFRNHTTSLPAYHTLSQVRGGSTSADLAVFSRLKAATTAFTFKTLFRNYAKRGLIR